MIFITGPLYSGKRTFAQRLPGTRIAEVQALAAEAEDLEKLAEELSAYDIGIDRQRSPLQRSLYLGRGQRHCECRQYHLYFCCRSG